ncbi:LacI family DNA-binding transcriptional regulator [Deinococcus sp. QL22]|uniref:LacI family DNA-binding transcriptional regulator n=1 Tax=Deinococcus sp. QL22 TaxID=2939437 RepID=UPI0020183A69|nr:LacI family DNA-binding transcriptional regulator [Deinococcus sp. QL22]UQN08951.1 LacI family transcriptional regulator [Deinococcus sp. QL22]
MLSKNVPAPAALTLNDVAQRAGVSPMTVSNVINGKQGVRAATRQRVLDAIAETGYRVNPMARMLAGGRNRIISVLTPQMNQPYASEVVQGAAGAAQRLDYDLIVMMSGSSDFSVMTQLSAGVLLIQPPSEGYDPRSDLPSHVVSVDGPSDYPLIVDNYGGACLAMQHLLVLGHTRIGFISGLQAEPGVIAAAHAAQSGQRNDAHERFRGYRESMASAGQRVLPEYVQHGDFTKASGERAAQVLLRLPTPPTALFVSGDAMALGAIHVAQDLGLQVPKDLSVVGFDDLPLAAAARPALTTVRQPLQQMGEAALELLVALAEHRPMVLPTPFPTTLIQRESTASPS